MTDVTATKPQTLTLLAKDGDKFEVELEVAKQIKYVSGMLEDVNVDETTFIPMGDVESRILAKIVEYCRYTILKDRPADEIERWEKEFVQVDKSTLFQLIIVSLFACLSPCNSAFPAVLLCLPLRVAVPFRATAKPTERDVFVLLLGSITSIRLRDPSA
jgi:hypothetical protein